MGGGKLYAWEGFTEEVDFALFLNIYFMLENGYCNHFTQK
jgi:hypothetical protein